jgi:hypothetical protein
MLHQLAIARQLMEGSHEIVPAWRIETHDGAFLVLTRFEPDNTEQRERALLLIGRFMVWKMATSYVLTIETWLVDRITRTGDEALLVVGVSRHERLASRATDTARRCCKLQRSVLASALPGRSDIFQDAAGKAHRN